MSVPSIENPSTNTITFPPANVVQANTHEYNDKGQAIIANLYALIKSVDREEALQINRATGIPVLEANTDEEAYALRKGKACIVFVHGKKETSTVLGAGVFGTVYLAKRLSDQTYLGVKEIASEYSILESKHEAVLQKKLANTPCIMPLYDFQETVNSGTQEPVIYQFMPLAGLGNVNKLRQQLIQLNDARLKDLIIIHIAKSLLLALWHMHRLHIAHLDVKPHNLVADLDGKIYLIDFGCAVEVNEHWPLLSVANNAQGPTIGKGDSGYFSNERKRAMDHATSFNCEKADLYAAGLTLLELTVGKHVRYMSQIEKEKSIPSGELGDLVQALFNCSSAEEVLNCAVFQRHEIHKEAPMEVAITYLKNFVRTATFQPKISRNSPPKTQYPSRQTIPTVTPIKKEEEYGISIKHRTRYRLPPARPSTDGDVSRVQSIVSKSSVFNSEEVQHLNQRLRKIASAGQPPLYVPLQASTGRQGLNVFELESAVDKWLESQRITLLLLADGGSGKSTFCQYYSWRQLQAVSAQDNNNNNTDFSWLPLYIPLTSVRNPKHLLEEILQDYGFNLQEIEYLKAHQRFLLILDGYNEMKTPLNLYVENEWEKWKVKMLITCCPSALPSDYDIHFLPYQQKQQAASIFEELYLIPFSSERINQYIETYIKKENKQLTKDVDRGRLEKAWLTAERYLHAIEEIPGLSTLVKNPFLLRLTVDVLPRLSKEKKYSRIKSVVLYEEFIIQWMEKQIAKETSSAMSSMISYDEVWEFGQKLAEKMYNQEINQARFAPQWKFDYQQGKFIEEKNLWSGFFSDSNAQTKLIRQRLPLVESDANTYAFIHLSILKYFTARKFYHELKATSSSSKKESPALKTIGLNLRLMTREHKDQDILQFLSEWVWSDPQFKALLFHAIDASMNDKGEEFEVAAANAVSILNRAKVSFSGLNFQKAKIPYADLTSGMFADTDFSDADLSYVKMPNAHLRGAKFNRANLNNISLGELPALQQKERVLQIVYSPDGCWLAVANGKNVCLWEVQMNTLKHTLQGHMERVTGVAFSSDSKLLVTCSWDKTIQLWDLSSMQRRHIFQGHTEGVNAVVFNPDNTLIASGSDDNTICLWNVKNGQKEHLLCGHMAGINSVIFSTDGKWLASASLDTTIRVWDTATREKKYILEGHSRAVNSIAFSPDNLTLASGSWDNKVILWDMQNGKEKSKLEHFMEVKSVAFSSDGKMLATGCVNHTVNVWDVMSEQRLYNFQGHTDSVNSVAFNTSNKFVASGSEDKTVRLWDITGREGQDRFDGHTHWVNSVVISKDGKTLASGGVDKVVCFWDIKNGQEQNVYHGNTSIILNLAFSPDGNMLALGTKDKIRLLDMVNKEEHILEGQAQVKSLAFSPDGKMLASGSMDKTVQIWEVITHKKLSMFEGHTSRVTGVDFSPDNKMLVTCGWDKTALLWNIKTKEKVSVLDGHTDKLTCVLFSPDGRTVASGSKDQTIRIWSSQSGMVQHTLKGHGHWVTSLAFSQDGCKLASGSMDNTVRIWDLASGQCIATLTGYFGSVESLAWSITGELFTGSADHSIKCWRFSNQHNHWQLVWSTHNSLTAEGCQLNQTLLLSPLNYQLLVQKGAMTQEPDIASQNSDNNNETFPKTIISGFNKLLKKKNSKKK